MDGALGVLANQICPNSIFSGFLNVVDDERATWDLAGLECESQLTDWPIVQHAIVITRRIANPLDHEVIAAGEAGAVLDWKPCIKGKERCEVFHRRAIVMPSECSFTDRNSATSECTARWKHEPRRSRFQFHALPHRDQM